MNQVQKAAKDKGFKFPVLIDIKSSNWDAWSNTMWPTVYVIDKDGYIRFWWQGELNWEGATVDKTIVFWKSAIWASRSDRLNKLQALPLLTRDFIDARSKRNEPKTASILMAGILKKFCFSSLRFGRNSAFI